MNKHVHKFVPSYWWDFDMRGDVIVQSDRAGGECLARFARPTLHANADAQIAQALALIDDYHAGRKTPNWHVRA